MRSAAFYKQSIRLAATRGITSVSWIDFSSAASSVRFGRRRALSRQRDCRRPSLQWRSQTSDAHVYLRAIEQKVGDSLTPIRCPIKSQARSQVVAAVGPKQSPGLLAETLDEFRYNGWFLADSNWRSIRRMSTRSAF